MSASVLNLKIFYANLLKSRYHIRKVEPLSGKLIVMAINYEDMH